MKRLLKFGAGLILAAALLWLLFRKTDMADLWAAMRRPHDLRWLLVCEGIVALGLVARALRWAAIVQPVKPVSFRHVFSATQIGYMANFVLPFRLGELARALSLTRLARVPLAQSVAMAAVDRVTDVFGMAVVVATAAFALWDTPDLRLPPETFGFSHAVVFSAAYVRTGAILIGTALAIAAPFTAMLYIHQARLLGVLRKIVNPFSTRLADWLCATAVQLVGGLGALESGPAMAMALTASLVTWATYLVSAQCIVFAFGLSAPWYFVFAQTALLALGVSVPSTPGLIGQYQIPIVIALAILVPGTSAADAKAFALVSYVLLEAPGVLLGVVCLLVERLRFADLTSGEPDN